jgi:hypothetical protein
MNIIEKRTRVRELKKAGIIPAHSAPAGVLIAAMTNDEADALLSAYDPESATFNPASVPAFERGVTQRELEAPAPRYTNGNGHAHHPQPAPAGDLAAIIAHLVAPHVQSSVTQEQFDTLANESATLAARLDEIALAAASKEMREIRVILPTGEKREIGRAHKTFPALLRILSTRSGDKWLAPFLVGPAGSFKTSAAIQASNALSLEFAGMSICQQTTQVSFFGYMDAGGNYVRTTFRDRYANGGIFLADEIDKGNANVLAVLNSALENGRCGFPDGMVKRHEDFRFIATANTYGNGGSTQYVGSCQMDAATLDRFTFLEWNYDEELEREIGTNHEWTERVFALRAAAARLNSRLIISPRATFEGAALIASGFTFEETEKMKVWKGIAPEERQKIEAHA